MRVIGTGPHRVHRPGPHRAGARTRWAVAGLLTAALAVLAGCGVPTQDGPRALSASQIPPGLRDNPPRTPTTTVPKYNQPVQIYFTRTVNGNKYVAPVTKYVPPKATLKSVLEVLITTGPSTLDIGNGYQTELTRTDKVLGVTVKGNVATVDFTQTFGLISGTPGALAVAQVVYTVTQNQPTVTQVVFQIEGRPATVPSATGAEVPGTVTAADYFSLTQPATATHPTAPTATIPAG